MRIVLILLLCCFVTGCATGRMEVADGVCSFEYASILKDVRALDLDLCGSTLRAGDSTSKDEVLTDVMKAATLLRGL